MSTNIRPPSRTSSSWRGVGILRRRCSAPVDGAGAETRLYAGRAEQAQLDLPAKLIGYVGDDDIVALLEKTGLRGAKTELSPLRRRAGPPELPRVLLRTCLKSLAPPYVPPRHRTPCLALSKSQNAKKNITEVPTRTPEGEAGAQAAQEGRQVTPLLRPRSSGNAIRSTALWEPFAVRATTSANEHLAGTEATRAASRRALRARRASPLEAGCVRRRRRFPA